MNERLQERGSFRAARSWVPTLDEIAQECARIRETWSEGERQRRTVRWPLWTVPAVSLDLQAS